MHQRSEYSTVPKLVSGVMLAVDISPNLLTDRQTKAVNGSTLLNYSLEVSGDF